MSLRKQNNYLAYHADWIALIDGKVSQPIRANFAFQAIHLPPSSKYLWLEFNPKSFWIGLYVSLITLILFLVYLNTRKEY